MFPSITITYNLWISTFLQSREVLNKTIFLSHSSTPLILFFRYHQFVPLILTILESKKSMCEKCHKNNFGLIFVGKQWCVSRSVYSCEKASFSFIINDLLFCRVVLLQKAIVYIFLTWFCNSRVLPKKFAVIFEWILYIHLRLYWFTKKLISKVKYYEKVKFSNALFLNIYFSNYNS